mgnify:CR=1 FL=1
MDYQKEYFKTIIVILLLSTIHQTALIMIPIIFIIQGKAFNKKTMFLIFLTLIVLVGVNEFTSFLEDALKETQYSDIMTNEIMQNKTGTNILRVVVYSVPLLLSIIGKRYIDDANDPLINLCVNCSVITTVVIRNICSNIRNLFWSFTNIYIFNRLYIITMAY